MEIPPDCSVGRIRGHVVKASDEPNDWQLIREDGTHIKCNIVNRQVQECVEAGVTKTWKAYAGVFKDKLVLKLCGIRDRQSADASYPFLIRGMLHRIEGDRIYFKVWSTRRKKFYFVLVFGFLPKAEQGQKWQVECEVEGDQLVIVDGQLLADKSNSSEVN